MTSKYKKGMRIKSLTNIVKIRCPNCGVIQKAIAEESLPFWIYIHECKSCNYLIMESEWDEVKEQGK